MEDALTDLERSGFEAFLPYLTSSGRTFVKGLDLEDAPGPGGGGEIVCRELPATGDKDIYRVECLQDGNSISVAVVETTRGPRIDLFAMQWDDFLGMNDTDSMGLIPSGSGR